MASPLLQRHSSKHRHGVLAELNVTPLLDLAFVLLVIFMITAPFLRQGVEISVPNSKSESGNSANLPETQVTVAVDASGNATLNGNPLPAEQVLSTLKLLREQNPDLAVVVETSRNPVVDVLEQVKASGVRKMGIVTRKQSPLP